MSAQPIATPDAKAPIYATFRNFRLLNVVRSVLPAQGRVLDIGCASGGLLRELAPVASYRAGVELSSVGAAAAREVADEVINAAIDDPAASFPPGSFDVIVCADVLEHVADPAATLGKIVSWCAPGGSVLVCVPNIANWQARLRLLKGVWRYADCGIWDDGHLRFFTLATLRELLEAEGLSVERVTSTQALAHQLPRFAKYTWPAWRALEPVVGLLARIRPQLFAFQLIAVGRAGTT